MHRLDQKNIYHLPIHDASFIKLSVYQGDTGEIDILIYIAFCEGEYEDLHQYSTVIGPNGESCFLLKDCTYINYSSYEGMAQRDSIDFVNISEITERKKLRKQVEILMVSGMKLACVATEVFLVKAE